MKRKQMALSLAAALAMFSAAAVAQPCSGVYASVCREQAQWQASQAQQAQQQEVWAEQQQANALSAMNMRQQAEEDDAEQQEMLDAWTSAAIGIGMAIRRAEIRHATHRAIERAAAQDQQECGSLAALLTAEAAAGKASGKAYAASYSSWQAACR